MNTQKIRKTAISKNDNIVCHGKTYHIQTEFYKTKNKIICNIFKDGIALKKIEKKIHSLEEEQLKKEILTMHSFVITKIKEGIQNISQKQSPVVNKKVTNNLNNYNFILNEQNITDFIAFEHILNKSISLFEKFVTDTKEIESCAITWKYLNNTFEFCVSERKDLKKVKNNLLYIWEKNETFLQQNKKTLNSIELIFHEKIFYLTQLKNNKNSIISIIQLSKSSNFTMFKQKVKRFLSELLLQKF